MESNEEIRRINEEIIKCRRCRLGWIRRNAVPGEGYTKARIMFVGEAPGREEDLTGRPFVGAAGHFLDELLSSIDLRRSDVFITNLLKCRPPRNRPPRVDEIEACYPFLPRQISVIKPRIICTLGNFAVQTLVDKKLSISSVHGIARKTSGDNEIVFFPTYHPAAALYLPRLRNVMKEDFKRLKALIKNEILSEDGV